MSNLLFYGHPSHYVRTLNTTLPVKMACHTQIFFFSFFGLGFPFCTPCHTGGLRIIILLWIPCILALITGRKSVMPSGAYSEFLGILLCGFPCLLSLCTLVKSGSPCKPILLLALLIYDSIHATLLCIILCATPIFS